MVCYSSYIVYDCKVCVCVRGRAERPLDTLHNLLSLMNGDPIGIRILPNIHFLLFVTMYSVLQMRSYVGVWDTLVVDWFTILHCKSLIINH